MVLIEDTVFGVREATDEGSESDVSLEQAEGWQLRRGARRGG